MRWACALLLFVTSVAHAHDVRGTVIYVDLGSTRAELEVQLPVQELQGALGLKTTWRGPIDSLGTPEQLRRYVGAHLDALSLEGKPLPVEVHDAQLTHVDDGDSVVAHVTVGARAFALHSDLIVHQVLNHNTFVFLRRDLQGGRLDEKPELLGMMHYQAPTLRIDRGQGSMLHALRATFALGMRHIDEGTDHLMFLLVLLLPAGLVARAGRWRETQASFWPIVRIVTAFTLAHSLTLLLGTLGVRVSATWVETAIACSIFVSALHALRPLFPGRELWVAASFGLVHGLAFSSALQGLAVDGPSLALSVLGFNLGVEAMQLIVVALMMPSLVALRSFAWVRIVGASFALVTSLGWIGERALGLHTPFPALAESLRAYELWLVGGLAIAALAPTITSRVSSFRGRAAAG